MNSTDQRGLVILPYAKGFSEKVTKVLRSFSIKVAHKPIRTISNILKNQKTKSGKKITEESCIRSDVTVVIVFMLVKHHAH